MSATPIAEACFLDVPGGRVCVQRWAFETDLAPIVLLHDSLGSVEQWRDFPQAMAHATQRTVIAYDRLGFGRSTPRSDPASPDFIDAEAVVFFALADAMGVSRCVPFGHSVGGAMALAIAAADPARCAAVVTESAQACVEARTRDGIRAAQVAFEDAAQFAKLARWHGTRAQWVLDAWTQVWLSPAFAGWSIDAALSRIACPVLAIHGERDEFGSVAFPERIAGGVRDGRAIVCDCGHVPHRERSADVLRWVAGFLAGIA